MFASTGKARAETLVFLDRMARKWDVDLRWPVYRDRLEAGSGIEDA